MGLSDVQKDAEAISRLIKDRITPLPQFTLRPLQEDGKNLLALEVSSDRSTPYYYKADGVMEAYIRVGNESVIAPNYIVNELILKGTNQSFDTLTTDVAKKDCSFTLLEATYLERTGLCFEPSDYFSFGLADKNGFFTNAGKLMTDQHTVYNSRMFCTRWNGLESSELTGADRKRTPADATPGRYQTTVIQSTGHLISKTKIYYIYFNMSNLNKNLAAHQMMNS